MDQAFFWQQIGSLSEFLATSLADLGPRGDDEEGGD